MPPITTIAPINRHRLILYSFVVIAPITTSNIPVTKMRQEMKACFCGLLFFIWSRSFVKFRVVELSILHKAVSLQTVHISLLCQLGFFQLFQAVSKRISLGGQFFQLSLLPALPAAYPIFRS